MDVDKNKSDYNNSVNWLCRKSVVSYTNSLTPRPRCGKPDQAYIDRDIQHGQSCGPVGIKAGFDGAICDSKTFRSGLFLFIFGTMAAAASMGLLIHLNNRLVHTQYPPQQSAREISENTSEHNWSAAVFIVFIFAMVISRRGLAQLLNVDYIEPQARKPKFDELSQRHSAVLWAQQQFVRQARSVGTSCGGTQSRNEMPPV